MVEVVVDVADDDADVGCQVVEKKAKSDLSKGGPVDFRPEWSKAKMKSGKKDTDDGPFEVDKDCCSNEDRGDGESNWVKYQGELLEIERLEMSG